MKRQREMFTKIHPAGGLCRMFGSLIFFVRKGRKETRGSCRGKIAKWDENKQNKKNEKLDGGKFKEIAIQCGMNWDWLFWSIKWISFLKQNSENMKVS